MTQVTLRESKKGYVEMPSFLTYMYHRRVYFFVHMTLRNEKKKKKEKGVLTLYILTSVCIISILFSKHSLKC